MFTYIYNLSILEKKKPTLQALWSESDITLLVDTIIFAIFLFVKGFLEKSRHFWKDLGICGKIQELL
jgi:hypothetical protein